MSGLEGADPPEGQPPAVEVTAADRLEVQQALPASTPVAKLDLFTQAHGQQTLLFRKIYGWVLLGALVIQVLVADLLVFLYAAIGVHWRIPSSVISAWLGSAVVEVIGVVYAITRSLFPLGDKGQGNVKL